MPFCTNCGNRVDASASFCHNCGTPQHPAVFPSGNDFLHNISDRTASILCYIPVFGVIPAILFLAAHKFRTNFKVRFDAFQGLYLFVTWLLISSAIPTLVFGEFPGGHVEIAIFGLLRFVVIGCWIFLLVKAAHEQQVRLPILGDLAARSIHEQL